MKPPTPKRLKNYFTQGVFRELFFGGSRDLLESVDAKKPLLEIFYRSPHVLPIIPLLYGIDQNAHILAYNNLHTYPILHVP